MHELSYDEFVRAWSTYWGRREVGIVQDNPTAERIASAPRALHLLHEQWLVAFATRPADASLWLMGTPDLAPGHLSKRTPDATGIAEPAGPPPAPTLGSYSTQTPSVSGLSERSGDYRVNLPTNSAAARTGRRIAAARPGGILGVCSLPLVGLPVIALPMALLALVWTSLAVWELRSARVSWRTRWPFVAWQAVALVSILLTLTLAAGHTVPTSPDPNEVSAMTRADGGTYSGEILARLRLHWPEAQVTEVFVDGDPDAPVLVRVRVADHVYLDTLPGQYAWKVQPMTDVSGSVQEWEGSRSYTIGVTSAEGAIAIADRFYEEVRFWWAKLHPVPSADVQADA